MLILFALLINCLVLVKLFQHIQATLKLLHLPVQNTRYLLDQQFGDQTILKLPILLRQVGKLFLIRVSLI